MKTLLSYIAMLCLLTNVINAQIASTDYSFSTKNHSSYTSIEKSNSETLMLEAMIAEKHTTAAEKQLKNYLAHSLQYSEMLIENGIEGDVLVAIDIAGDGSLTSFDVLESPHVEVTKMVQQALQNLSAVNFKNQWYRGGSQVEISLNFSIK